MNKKITIIFVSFYSKKKVIKYLKQFNNEFRVIIIENSNDKSLKNLINKYSNVEIIFNSVNQGFGKGSNLGLRKVKTKYALHLDLDTKFSNNCIVNLINLADKNNDFGIIGPKISGYNYKENDFKNKNIKNKIHSMNFIDGCCLLFNMKALRKVGYFDENFFLYYEESDLIKRFIDKKQKILMSEVVKIFHKGRSSTDKKYDIEIEINRNWHLLWSKFYYNYKHFGYFYAFLKIFKHFITASFKSIYYLFNGNILKSKIYKARLSGCINSILLKKSWYRPNIN